MTASRPGEGISGFLRLGQRAAFETPPTNLQTQRAGVDGPAYGARQPSADSLTEHIEFADETPTSQPSLFDKPLRFDGATYLPWRDDERLTGQLRRVWGCVRDGCWWTPSELERATGDNWSSISAQLRHLRKERFGSHVIEREHLGNGLYQYRLAQP